MEQSHLDQNLQDFCSINLRSNSPHNKEVMVTEQKGKPCLTAGSTQPLHLQPYLLPRGQHTPGKDADSC